MKFPSLALAVSLALGILIGGTSAAHLPFSTRLFLGASCALLFLGFLLLGYRRVVLAGITSLLAWSMLGAAAAQLPALAVPADHVTKLFAQGTLDSTEPLRWRGRLRADPLLLPWGTRYDVDLEAVQAVGNWLPIAGGMRVDFYNNERAPENPGPRRGIRGVRVPRVEGRGIRHGVSISE